MNKKLLSHLVVEYLKSKKTQILWMVKNILYWNNSTGSSEL